MSTLERTNPGNHATRQQLDVAEHASSNRLRGFDRFVRYHGGALRHRVNAYVSRYSLIPNTPVLAPGIFPWAERLEADWRDYRAEVAQALPSNPPAIAELAPDHETINPDHGWKTVFLMGYGHPVPQTIARFPVIWNAVKDIPGLFSALVSVHAPGTHLAAHEGVTKGFVTAHLPLFTPRDAAACRIRVDGTDHIWREGELFVFDDTYTHETWNDTPDLRVNLMIHVKRPMHGRGAALQRVFFWVVDRVAFVREARRNVEAWAKAWE